MEVVIQARGGRLPEGFARLVGLPVAHLDAEQAARFEDGCCYGDLYLGEYDEAKATVSTFVGTARVAISIEGASCQRLCKLIHLIAAEEL